jgi:hypothetical protein
LTPRPSGRTTACTRAQAATRLQHAEKFLEVAELVETEAETDPAMASVSASLAVLAGIAASDAACGASLGMRSRGQDHRQAADLLAHVAGSHDAVRSLRRLLDLKDSAHYGVIHVGPTDLKTALRAARTILDCAQTALR